MERIRSKLLTDGHRSGTKSIFRIKLKKDEVKFVKKYSGNL